MHITQVIIFDSYWNIIETFFGNNNSYNELIFNKKGILWKFHIIIL